MFPFKPKEQDVRVYTSDTEYIYARGVLCIGRRYVRITRADGAVTIVPARQIKFIKTYKVREDEIN